MRWMRAMLWLGMSLVAVHATRGEEAAPAQKQATKANSFAEQTALFFDHVRPLLVSKCQQCHGADAQEGELRLDSRSAALRGGSKGPSIVPGKPGESLLLRAVQHASGELRMPPKGKLPAEDIAKLAQWIADGAVWPQPAMALFEDEPALVDALKEGGGSIRLDASDKHQGAASLVVAPQRHAVNIADWNFPIREQPGAGEYRYIRFAWKSRGSGAILFEVARNGTWREQAQTNGAWVAGKNTTGWGAIPLANDPPQDWTVVTRDLWADGNWGDFDLTGLCLTAVNGGEALVDSILLGPDLESLDAYRPGRGKLAWEHADKQPVGDAWSDPRNPIRKLFQGQRLDLWSLKKPVHTELPEVENASWVKTPVDRFVLAKLTAEGLKPSPEADRRTLIRRLTFDLIGLPPTSEEVQTFLKDESADAYEQLVERLLASPHYGQRAARQWLDVVRYADTNNFERDEFRPQMWRYRDWVIRAFNADKPYDQFVQEQLAGDEMVTGLPQSQTEAEALIATGFLRLGPWDSTASIFQEDQRGRDQLMADLVNTTGSAMLGMTLACCNCHDHKYDPLSQADHFRLRGFFAGVKFRDDLVIDPPEARTEVDLHNKPLDAAIEQARQEQVRLLSAAKKRVAISRQAELTAEVKQLLQKPADKRSPEELRQLQPVLEKLNVNDKDARTAFTPAEKESHEAAEKRIQEQTALKRSYQTATGMTDSGQDVPAVHLFFQGDYTQPREAVLPGFLSVLDPNPVQIAPSKNAASSGRRSALADWLLSPENPLTARVMVNRIWQQHFGVGIVATPNDFGYSGARPTHPELLDWLALEFQRRSWSVKEMHRLIVLSATYRQVSTSDANKAKPDLENKLLWRQNIQRLPAESLRDAMLHVSGRLLPASSGPPRWPPVPDEILSAQPAILEAMEGKDDGRGQGYPADPLEETYVRSIFLVQKSSVPLPFLQAFDLPETSVSCGRRNVTTVAPQALTLLNNPFSVAMAQAFAERVRKEAGADRGRQIDRAVWLALSRSPLPEEKTLLLEMLNEHQQQHAERLKKSDDKASEESALNASAELAALVDLCRALLNVNEFAYVD